MTSFPARRFGFADRGVVGVGMHADLVVFDLDALTEHATYEAGRAPATGVSHVFVNGRPVLWEGELTGELPGRAVRSRGDPRARGRPSGPPRAGERREPSEKPLK